MSGKLMGLCYNLAITRSQRDVLLAFADHADKETGTCWPSVELIAWKLDLSDRQVQRIIRQLESLDLMTAIENAQGGRNVTPTYQINLRILFGLERTDLQKTPLPPKRRKGDIAVSPFIMPGYYPATAGTPPGIAVPNAAKGDIDNRKSDIMDQKGDISDVKGDIAVSPEPSVRTVTEPSEENRHHHHKKNICGFRGGGLGEGKDSDSLRSSGASSLHSEDASTENWATEERVIEAKRRYYQFTSPKTRKMMIDSALGNDEQAKERFSNWLAQLNGQSKSASA